MKNCVESEKNLFCLSRYFLVLFHFANINVACCVIAQIAFQLINIEKLCFTMPMSKKESGNVMKSHRMVKAINHVGLGERSLSWVRAAWMRSEKLGSLNSIKSVTSKPIIVYDFNFATQIDCGLRSKSTSISFFILAEEFPSTLFFCIFQRARSPSNVAENR